MPARVLCGKQSAMARAMLGDDHHSRCIRFSPLGVPIPSLYLLGMGATPRKSLVLSSYEKHGESCGLGVLSLGNRESLFFVPTCRLPQKFERSFRCLCVLCLPSLPPSSLSRLSWCQSTPVGYVLPASPFFGVLESLQEKKEKQKAPISRTHAKTKHTPCSVSLRSPVREQRQPCTRDAELFVVCRTTRRSCWHTPDSISTYHGVNGVV